MIEIGDGLAKSIGVLAGTALALVFYPPKTRRDFLQRAFIAIVFGAIFGPVVIWKFEVPNTTETIIASFAGAAFASWWILGAIKTASEKLGAKTDK